VTALSILKHTYVRPLLGRDDIGIGLGVKVQQDRGVWRGVAHLVMGSNKAGLKIYEITFLSNNSK
jgi:hypothetical protein